MRARNPNRPDVFPKSDFYKSFQTGSDFQRYLGSSASNLFIDWDFSLGHMSMDLPSVLAALSSPMGPWVTGTSIRVVSSQGCNPGLAGPEPSRPLIYPGLHLQSEGQEKAEVEAIVTKAMRDGVVHYVFWWKGYGEGDDTEEPAESLRHCQELVDAYERENGDETMYEPEKGAGRCILKCAGKGFGVERDTVEPDGNLPPWLLEQFRYGSGVVDI